VRENPSGFVLNIQVTGERERALALDFVAEDRHGREVGLQGQLVEGEQGAGGEREILAACLAAEAERAVRAAGLVAGRALAVRAHRLAIRLGPAERGEQRLGFLVPHAQHGRQTQRSGTRGKEEMLGHRAVSGCLIPDMITEEGWLSTGKVSDTMP
jgi:hypothetical protein